MLTARRDKPGDIPEKCSTVQPTRPDKSILAMEDLVLGEHMLVSQLDRLVNHYLCCLPRVSSKVALSSFVRGASSLLELHTRIEAQLRANQQDRASMCRVLASHAPQLSTLHSEFHSNYILAKTMIDREQAGTPQVWETWRKERAAKCPPEKDGSRPRSLEALMIAPIQRAFRYSDIISGFRGGTNDTEVENAILAMQTIATAIDRSVRRHESHQRPRVLLEHIDPIPGQRPEFLSTLGPYILTGGLGLTYYSTPALKPSSIPSHISSSASMPPPTRLPCIHNSLDHCSDLAHPKHLVAFLWKGYFLLCQPYSKNTRYKPRRWFLLNSDVAVLADNSIFPFGIRVMFGRHVFDLGAASVEERDSWIDHISSSRVSLEEGKVLDSRAYAPPLKSSLKFRLRPRTSPTESTTVDKGTGQKGLVRTRSDGALRSWCEAAGHTSSTTKCPKGTNITQTIRGAPGSTARGAGIDDCYARFDHHDRRAVVNHSSNSSIFRQLVAKGCVDLSLHMDPKSYSSRPMAGGGLADIWRGQLLDGTRVAIKVWRDVHIERDDPKQLKRAMREVYNWSKLDHQNVQQLMGVLMFQDRLGMVSLWMEYGSLREYVKQHSDIDRLPLCTQVATGLSYLHDNNMVHGDLKTGNILVSSDGVAKLGDFGHSVLSECTLIFSETTDLGGGTLRWMAPELLTAPDIESGPLKKNKQTDIYALGMTFLVRKACGKNWLVFDIQAGDSNLPTPLFRDSE